MSEDVFTVLFNYVYAPFAGALVLVVSFFWKLRNIDKANVESRLIQAVSSEQVTEITTILKTISEDITENKIIGARLDERIKSIEGSVERRTNPR